MTPSAPALAIARTWAGLLTPNPTATGTGDAALTSRTSRPTDAGSAVRAPGHADERDAVEEAAAPGGDRGAPGRRRRRGDEVDDGQPGRPGDGLERRALVGRQVGDDQAGRAGAGQPPGDGLAVAAADDLVGVAHRDERQVRPGGTDPLDQPERALERRAGRERDARTRAGAWRRRPAGPSTAARPRAGPRRHRRRRGRSRSSCRRPGSRRRRTG